MNCPFWYGQKKHSMIDDHYLAKLWRWFKASQYQYPEYKTPDSAYYHTIIVEGNTLLKKIRYKKDFQRHTNNKYTQNKASAVSVTRNPTDETSVGIGEKHESLLSQQKREETKLKEHILISLFVFFLLFHHLLLCFFFFSFVSSPLSFPSSSFSSSLPMVSREPSSFCLSQGPFCVNSCRVEVR